MALLFAIPIKAQKGIEDGSKYGSGQDSINCLMNLSLYREFFKHSNYKDALGPWIKVFSECPASSEKMYVDGVQMYRNLIDASANSSSVKEELIDTLMLIYDRRAEYFGGEGNVLGRKGIDRLRYRRDDIESINIAYNELKRSIEKMIMMLSVNSIFHITLSIYSKHFARSKPPTKASHYNIIHIHF